MEHKRGKLKQRFKKRGASWTKGWVPYKEGALEPPLWTMSYCFPPFSITLKVLENIQQDQAQAIVVVLYWNTHNWFLVLLGILVDHPLTMTASLNMLYLPTHPAIPHPLHFKLKLLVAHISEEILSDKMFLQQHNIFSCPHHSVYPLLSAGGRGWTSYPIF